MFVNNIGLITDFNKTKTVTVFYKTLKESTTCWKVNSKLNNLLIGSIGTGDNVNINTYIHQYWMISHASISILAKFDKFWQDQPLAIPVRM